MHAAETGLVSVLEEADILHVVIELNEDWVRHHELQPSFQVSGSLAWRWSVERGTPEALKDE